MYYPNSIRLITARLHQLSSIAKLSIIGVFWLIISFGQNIFPGLVFNNQVILSVAITIAFVTNVVTEIVINIKKENNQEFDSILNLQIVFNTILLLSFLVLIDRINGPLFILCTLTLMESSLNLNLFLPSIIVIITGTATLVEWVLLVFAGQILPDLVSISALVLRILLLVFLMGYGRSLAESLVAAGEVDKMKDEFISITSHELRTPMTSVKSYLWMALSGRGGKLSPKHKYYLERSYNSTERLIKLVNDMLNISRIESGHISLKVEKVDMVSLVNEVVNDFNYRAKSSGISFKINPDIKSAFAIADADKIKEVILNLIDNGIKYSPPKSIIEVKFRISGDLLITEVIDNGFGMSPAIVKNLFQKFGFVRGSYQINQSTRSSGTGLGLYICKQIITLHDGTIQGKSAGLGKGSTFSFTLPLYSVAKLAYYKRLFNRSSQVGIIHNKV